MWNYYRITNGEQIFRCEARARNILRYAAKFMCQDIYDVYTPCIHLITGERAFMTSSVHSHRDIALYVSSSLFLFLFPFLSDTYRHTHTLSLPFLIYLAFSRRRGFSLLFVANKITLTIEASNRAKKEPRERTRERQTRRRSLLTGSHAFNCPSVPFPLRVFRDRSLVRRLCRRDDGRVLSLRTPSRVIHERCSQATSVDKRMSRVGGSLR